MNETPTDPAQREHRPPPALSPGTFRRWVLLPMAVLLLVGVGLAFAPFIRAQRAMDGFCSALPAGASLEEVKARAAAQGYTVAEPGAGQARVEDPRSPARLWCDLAFGDKGLATRRAASLL